MRKIIVLTLTICTTALIYVSCSSSDDVVNQTDPSAVGASVAIDAANEMDVKTGLSVTASAETAKTTETGPITCSTITVAMPNGTAYPKVFTVDYGAGCTINQLERKGKLKITLTGPIITTGSKMTIERIDYSLAGLKLEGTIEYTNTTTIATVPQWTRKVTNGKFTDLQGRVFLNSGTFTTKQTAGVDTPYVLEDNVYEIPDGTHTVTTDKGGTLTLTVKETLVKKYSCEFISKGELQVVGGYLNGVVDYGNNECDNKYTYYHENGTAYNLSM